MLVDGNNLKTPDQKEVIYVNGTTVRYFLTEHEFEEIAKGKTGGWAMNFFMMFLGILIPSVAALIHWGDEDPYQISLADVALVACSFTGSVIFGILGIIARKNGKSIYSRIKKETEVIRQSPESMKEL